MRRINEFKGYRSETHFDESIGVFVTRRAEDAIAVQEPAGSSEIINVKRPVSPEAAALGPEIQHKLSLTDNTGIDPAAATRCEARIMFDMVAVIGSRSLARESCATAK